MADADWRIRPFSAADQTAATGRIVRVSVSQTHRRRGIGRTLVAHLLQTARRRGFRHVLVETNHDWTSAIALYRHCGFTETDRDEESIHLSLSLE